MAIKKIDYDDKESLQNDENIPNKNKVIDLDMNQIKEVVNNNATELETAENNITELDKVVAQNKRNIESIQGQVTNLEVDNTTNKKDISKIKEKNNEQDEKINSNTSKLEELENNKVDKVDGKGLSTNDFTNEDKSKLDSLENYNDSKIKQDISEIQQEQETQNKNIESIQKVDEKQDDLIQKLKDNSINITTEEATQLHIEDASELPAILDVRGNHYQKVTETAENVFNGKLEPGEWNYNTGEKTDVENRIRSVDYIDITGQTQISTVKKNGGTFGLAIRFYDADKNYIGRVSSPEVVDGVTNNVNNDLDNAKTVKYATLTILDTTDTTLEFAVNKGADLSWHDFIPNSPSLAYPSEVRAVGDNVNILPNEAESKSKNGIEWTVNEDGSVKAIGTATNNEGLYLIGNSGATEEVFRFKANKQYKNVSNVDILYRKTDGDYGRLQKNTVFSFLEDEVIGLVYLQIASGETVDETYYPKIVEYYEGIDESYSPYEQGSVEIKKINANLLNNKETFKNIGRTINGLTISQSEDGAIVINGTATAKTQFELYPTKFKIIKGFKFDKFVRRGTISSEQALTCTLFNEKWSNIALNNYNNNLVSSTDIVSIIQFQINADAVFNNYEINYVISKETLDSFIENEEINYILSILDKMFKGDYFDLKRGKEVHHSKEYISTSEDNWILTPDQSNRFRLDKSDTFISLNNTNQLCSHCKTCYNWGNAFESFQVRNGSTYFRTAEISTAEEFNRFVAEQEEKGTLLTFWYECEEYELDLTEKQKAVLQELQKLDIFKGTNNIITAEDLALLQLNYIADTQSYVDNRIDEKLANINAQILEIAGGN